MRARELFTLLSVIVLTAVTAQVAEAAPARPGDDEAIDYHEWNGGALYEGRFAGLALTHDGLRITRPVGTVEHTEPELGTTKTYEYGQWTSPSYRQGFGATQLVASWNAKTPEKTWLEVEAQARTSAGAETAWYVLGRWASGDGPPLRCFSHRRTRDGRSKRA